MAKLFPLVVSFSSRDICDINGRFRSRSVGECPAPTLPYYIFTYIIISQFHLNTPLLLSSSSSLLFNIYQNELIVKWNQIYTKALLKKPVQKWTVLFFAEDNSQRQVFWIGMSPERRADKKEFLGKDGIRCKIILDNKCLQQIENFKYLSLWNFLWKWKRC